MTRVFKVGVKEDAQTVIAHIDLILKACSLFFFNYIRISRRVHLSQSSKYFNIVFLYNHKKKVTMNI